MGLLTQQEVSMPRRRPTPDSTADGANGHAAPRWSPRDMLVPYVLLAVSIQRAHGYFIEDYLKKTLKYTGPDMSTLYRTLRQLEKDGLLLSTWEPGPTGPARRVYSITDAGRAWLDTWGSMLDAYRGMIDNFFSFYTGAYSGASSRETRAHAGDSSKPGAPEQAPAGVSGGDTGE